MKLKPKKISIYFNFQVDCEALQPALKDAALGKKAITGLCKILNREGLKGNFAVIPSDIKAHAAIYRDIAAQGHEVGLHLHPADQGYEEFLGVYGFEDQKKIIKEAADVFFRHMRFLPASFTPGYASANDHTFSVLEALGFRHGTVSIPTRNLPQCACIWGNSPQAVHYPHHSNRALTGNVDFVEIPCTVDPESRMWGGAHPQDLRVELVDAKNHWYTINKNVARQVQAGDGIPVKHIKIVTHNIFDYSDTGNFRRETLLGMIAAMRDICAKEDCRMIPATNADIAAVYRRLVPLPKDGVKLALDRRGWAGMKTKRRN